MSSIALSLFKEHVRADEFNDDDVTLQHYLDTAEEFAVTYCHRTEQELKDMNDGENYPKPVVQAVLLLAGDWYDKREDTMTSQAHPIPNGARTLLMPYRKLSNSYTS